MAANGRSSGSAHANVRLAAATGRRRRLRTPCLVLTLVIFLPVLLPLAFLSFPLLCLAGICFRLGRAKTIECQREPESAPEAERRLLHRYLEDQLGLVGGGFSVDFGGGGGVVIIFFFFFVFLFLFFSFIIFLSQAQAGDDEGGTPCFIYHPLHKTDKILLFNIVARHK